MLRGRLDIAFSLLSLFILCFFFRLFLRWTGYAHLVPDVFFKLHSGTFQLPDHPVFTSDGELAWLVAFLQATNDGFGGLGGFLRLVRLGVRLGSGVLAMCGCGG